MKKKKSVNSPPFLPCEKYVNHIVSILDKYDLLDKQLSIYFADCVVEQ